VLFVHGLLVNGDLWRKVVPTVAEHYRCITPDWPLGSHEVPMKPSADLTIPGMARLIADFIEALKLRDVTLVANDTGGAITQVLMTQRPENIGRVVLTSCDAYENFLPMMFRPLQYLAHAPALLTVVLQAFRLKAIRRSPLGFGWLAKRPIADKFEQSYAGPVLESEGVRRDCFKVLRSISPRHTLAAAERFAEFDKPVLVAWSAEDRFFPPSHGSRLASAFPKGRFKAIPDCYTFSSEDQPDALAKLIVDFAAETAGATGGAPDAQRQTG
jgi:pimeloyl-ACP methyl ester carboxylesterase